MMKDNYIAESINIDSPITESSGMELAREYTKKNNFEAFMSNSFGFGGTNASLIVKKYS